MKNRLIIVPHYIGSLKYLEKLLPELDKKYDIYFLPKWLFLNRLLNNFSDTAKSEMEIYLEEKNINIIIFLTLW